MGLYSRGNSPVFVATKKQRQGCIVALKAQTNWKKERISKIMTMGR
jgi:hypothetical protein